jgi:pimeloyl-ACP methyl ester carboxylesterase
MASLGTPQRRYSMPYITVGKENSGPIDLYYEDHGTGKPVVLVHGWPLSSKSWEKQVPALIDAGYRVVAYDRRGFGNSAKPTLGYDYDTLAGDLHTLMTELDLAGATLVGFSMGGGEVARYLGTYGSNRVERAVFISAIPPFLLKTADNPEGVEGSAFDGFMESIAADRPAFLTGFFQDFYNVDVYGGDRISDEVLRLSWNIAAAASPRGTLDCVPAWLTDFRGDLAKIDVPVLVIHGDADRIVPFPASGKRIHDTVEGSRLVVIEGGPHGITWTHAGEVNRELLGFLEERVEPMQPVAGLS